MNRTTYPTHQQDQPPTPREFAGGTSAPDCVAVEGPPEQDDHGADREAFIRAIRRDFPDGIPDGQFVTGYAGSPQPPQALRLSQHVRASSLFRPTRLSLATPPAATPTRSLSHSRERRSATRARRGPPSDDDGPEPPLVCAGCGEEFSSFGNRSDRAYCSQACRNRARQARHRARRKASPDAVMARYHREVAKARLAQLLTADEALDLRLDPSPRVLELLAAEAAA